MAKDLEVDHGTPGRRWKSRSVFFTTSGIAFLFYGKKSNLKWFPKCWGVYQSLCVRGQECYITGRFMWKKLNGRGFSFTNYFSVILEARWIWLHLVVGDTAFSARRQEYETMKKAVLCTSAYLSPWALITWWIYAAKVTTLFQISFGVCWCDNIIWCSSM